MIILCGGEEIYELMPSETVLIDCVVALLNAGENQVCFSPRDKLLDSEIVFELIPSQLLLIFLVTFAFLFILFSMRKVLGFCFLLCGFVSFHGILFG